MSKKSDIRGLYVIKKKKGLADVDGGEGWSFRKKPRLLIPTITGTGEEELEDKGE